MRLMPMWVVAVRAVRVVVVLVLDRARLAARTQRHRAAILAPEAAPRTRHGRELVAEGVVQRHVEALGAARVNLCAHARRVRVLRDGDGDGLVVGPKDRHGVPRDGRVARREEVDAHDER